MRVKKSRRFSVASFLVIAAALVPTPADADEARPHPADPTLVPRERLQALVEHMRAAAAARETMSADFTQTKESSLLIEPGVAHGRFSYRAPDHVRWEYHEPEAMTLLIRDGVALTWFRNLGKAERYHVGRQSQRVLEYLGASSSIQELVDYFRISMQSRPEQGQPYWLHLEPRYSRIAKHLEELELWIDFERYLPVRVRYVETGGDVTEYRFSNFEINADIPLSSFEVDLPEDVEVRDVDLPRRTKRNPSG